MEYEEIESNAGNPVAEETQLKRFKMIIPLTQDEVKFIHDKNLLESFVEIFDANVFITNGIILRFLNIVASIDDRYDIQRFIRKYLKIPKVRKSLRLLFNKIEDYPLIEEVRDLAEPFDLYETYTNLLEEHKPVYHPEVARIIKKLNIFRCLHCIEFTKQTTSALNLLYDLSTVQGQPMSFKLQGKAISAYKRIFQNIESTELNTIIDEFNSKKFNNKEKIRLLPKLIVDEDQKSRLQKEDMDLYQYLIRLKEPCKRSKNKDFRFKLMKNIRFYDAYKKFYAKNRRAIKILGKKLNVPFQCTEIQTELTEQTPTESIVPVSHSSESNATECYNLKREIKIESNVSKQTPVEPILIGSIKIEPLESNTNECEESDSNALINSNESESYTPQPQANAIKCENSDSNADQTAVINPNERESFPIQSQVNATGCEESESKVNQLDVINPNENKSSTIQPQANAIEIGESDSNADQSTVINPNESESSTILPQTTGPVVNKTITKKSRKTTKKSRKTTKKSRKTFKLNFALAENELKIINDTNLINHLIEQFNANVSINNGITLKFLHIKGNFEHRKNAWKCIRKFINIQKIELSLFLP
ncbi:uncharacterized protein LOC123294801 [Chrysoperla carnea]|uniref:uncharacterized protein LOC123294801 n=1 Tax=Chrysoperla carnea TaxID=189513 RepID=UPI001D079B83|nr:uncharacterized protein LOC123294801 [Chrysoperla carnea]